MKGVFFLNIIIKFISKIKNIYLFVISSIIVYLYNADFILAVTTNGTGDMFMKSFNKLSKFANGISNGMLGISIISGIFTMIYHLIRLGGVGSNSNARAKVLQDMLTTVICIALLGGIGLVMKLIISYSGGVKINVA